MRVAAFASIARALLLLSVALAGCGPKEEQAAVVAAPEAPDTAECAVCGMTVRDQPSPRGQLMHRDGAHKHFCSLGDLRAYLQTPSSLGEPVGVWVEDLGPGYDMLAFDTTFRPWTPASGATYVVGVARPRIMGLPVLSFADPAHATDHVTDGGAHATSWTALESTPFSEIPPEIP